MTETETNTNGEEPDDWEALAEQLHERGGVAETRARVVAMAAAGYSQQDIADSIGYSSSGSISNHIKRYREEDRPQAEWLVEHGPEL